MAKFSIGQRVRHKYTTANLEGNVTFIYDNNNYEHPSYEIVTELGGKQVFGEGNLEAVLVVRDDVQYDASVKHPLVEVCDNLKYLLLYKNSKYGNSGLEPINVFSKQSAETGLLQRIDDKIARIKTSPDLRKNDVADLFGYLALLCVNKGWTNFDEFKD